MTLLQAIILGVIQGLTEFLPISSTAHLTLAGRWMGLLDPARPEEWTAFLAIVQLGTVAAVLVYFAADLRDILRGALRDLATRRRGEATAWGPHARLAAQIAIGSLPVAAIGFAFKKAIEGAVTKEVPVIATSLIVLALVLWWAERRAALTRSEGDATWKDALLIGCAQSLALIPGSSRSGTTITAALFLGFERRAAARFSFLLSIPAVLASGAYQLLKSYGHIEGLATAELVVATVTAALVGYAAIAFLLSYLRSHSTTLFIVYRVVLGAALWAMVAARVL